MSTGAPTLQDAYCKWLGIAAAQTPPDHYTLLGIPQFESDQEKIRCAVLERTKIVRPRSFKYHELGTQLLNEIAAAGVCLSDPKTKTEYDAALRTGGTKAALEVSRKTPQNQSRLREILQAAGRDDLLARADGKPGIKPATPAIKPAEPAKNPAATDDLTLAPVDPTIITATAVEVVSPLTTPDSNPGKQMSEGSAAVATVPFAPSSDAREMGQALLLAGGLAAAVLVGIVGFVSWRMSGEPGEPQLAQSSAYTPAQPPLPPASEPGESSDAKAAAPFNIGVAAAGPGGNGPTSGMGMPSYPGAPAPEAQSASPNIKLHRYLGRIQRIECRGSKTHLLLIPLEPHESAAVGPSPPNVEQLAWYGVLEAVADERDFHKKILDYWSTEEVINASSGGEAIGYPSRARTAGDAVEIFGAPLFESFPRPDTPSFTIKIQRLARINDASSLVEVGINRSSWNQSDLAGRSLVDAMLRGVEGSTNAVPVSGITVNPILNNRVNVRLAGTDRGVAFRFSPLMASSVSSKLGPGANHKVSANVYFSGEFDDYAQPILDVLSIGYKAAPRDVATASGLSPLPASATGEPPLSPRSPALGPKTSPRTRTPRPVAAVTPAEGNERFYVVRYFDRSTKATYFEIAGSKEEREQMVKNLRAVGLRPVAVAKTFDSYADAEAYADKEAAKANR